MIHYSLGEVGGSRGGGQAGGGRFDRSFDGPWWSHAFITDEVCHPGSNIITVLPLYKGLEGTAKCCLLYHIRSTLYQGF